MITKALRAIKPEIRVLGVDDGRFTPLSQGKALIVGVVFRGGYSIDGVMHTKITVDGLDATEKITAMINESPHRRQIQLIMLSGITFAGFNLIDIQKLNQNTGIRVLSLTREKPDLDAICNALTKLSSTEERRMIVQNAGEIHQIENKGSKLYMSLSGVTFSDALRIIELTSTISSLPEPLRVAHLIASGVTS